MGNDDIVARLHAKKYTREAWDEPYGAYDQPCDADDYGAEERLVNPDGPEAGAEIERLRGLFRLDGEQHAQHIKRLTEAHEARITKYATALAEGDATIERLTRDCADFSRLHQGALARATTAERDLAEARAEVERVKTERDEMEQFIRAVASKKYDGEMYMSLPPKPVISYNAERIIEKLDRDRAALAKGGADGDA